MTQKNPSLPRGWNEGLNMMVVAHVRQDGVYHIMSDDARTFYCESLERFSTRTAIKTDV